MLQIKFVSLQCQTIKKKQNNINIIKHLSIMGLDIYIHKAIATYSLSWTQEENC